MLPFFVQTLYFEQTRLFLFLMRRQILTHHICYTVQSLDSSRHKVKKKKNNSRCMHGVRSVGRQNELHTKTKYIYTYIYYGRNWRLQNLFSGNGQTIASTICDCYWKETVIRNKPLLSFEQKKNKNRPSVWQTMFPRSLSTACWMHAAIQGLSGSGWVCWGRPYISFFFFFPPSPFLIRAFLCQSRISSLAVQPSSVHTHEHLIWAMASSQDVSISGGCITSSSRRRG